MMARIDNYEQQHSNVNISDNKFKQGKIEYV